MNSFRTMSTILCILFVLLFNHICIAYDNEYAHIFININAVKKSNIDTILREEIGFKNGENEKLLGEEVWEWIRDGGFEEDEPAWRCLRHFHDPIKTWNEAGLLNLSESLIYWAQQSEPSDQLGESNEYSWQSARTYFHQALLTGSEDQYAKTFRALGQVMHLVSDAAVPAHVRNDPHIPYIFDADPYENWVKKIVMDSKKSTTSITFGDFTVDPAIFKLAVSDDLVPSPISALWDNISDQVVTITY